MIIFTRLVLTKIKNKHRLHSLEGITQQEYRTVLGCHVTHEFCAHRTSLNL